MTASRPEGAKGIAQMVLSELDHHITRDGDLDTPEQAEEIVVKALVEYAREQVEAAGIELIEAHHRALSNHAEAAERQLQTLRGELDHALADLGVCSEHQHSESRPAGCRYCVVELTDQERDTLAQEKATLEAEVAKYQRESADENTCTAHPKTMLAYTCAACHTELEARERALREALKQIAQGPTTPRSNPETPLDLARDVIECSQNIARAALAPRPRHE